MVAHLQSDNLSEPPRLAYIDNITALKRLFSIDSARPYSIHGQAQWCCSSPVRHERSWWNLRMLGMDQILTSPTGTMRHQLWFSFLQPKLSLWVSQGSVLGPLLFSIILFYPACRNYERSWCIHIPVDVTWKTWHVGPTLFYCWPTVYDVGPTINQR